MPNYKTQWELFFDKVDKNGPACIHPVYGNIGQCWTWLGSKRAHGHGYFWFDGCVDSAHRFTIILTGNEIPEGKNALHHCDNGSCVNPDHIFLGTQKENALDMVSKGRERDRHEASMQHRGTGNASAILTEADVLRMRAMRKQIPRPSVKAIAALFPQVSVGTVKRILLHLSWKHL